MPDKILEERKYLYYLGSKDQLNKNGIEMIFTKLFKYDQFFHFLFRNLITFKLNSKDAKAESLEKWSFYSQADRKGGRGGEPPLP